jgi:hypothetical protein
VCLHSGFILDRPIDRKLTLWLGSLAALAAVNVALWIWIARSASLRTPYAETQLLSVPSAPPHRRKSICDQAMSGGDDGILLLVERMPPFHEADPADVRDSFESLRN